MLDATSLKNSQEPISYWDTDGHAVILGALLTLAAFGAVFGGLSYFDVAPLQYDFQWIGWGICAAAAIYPICVGVSALFNQCVNPIETEKGVKHQPNTGQKIIKATSISSLDIDLIGLVLSYLPGASIARCSQVSHAWGQLCFKHQPLYRKMSLANIKAITPSIEKAMDREAVINQLPENVARFDVNEAKELALSLKNVLYGERDAALLKIMEIEAGNDIKKAEETMSLIEKPFNVVKALAILAKYELVGDKQKARDTLQTAKEKAGLLQDNTERFLAYLDIVGTEKDIDIEEAKVTLKRTEELIYFKKYYRGILLRTELKIDVRQAHDNLKLLEDPSYFLFVEVAKAEIINGNLEQARQALKQGIELVLSEESSNVQVRGLVKIAKVQFSMGDQEIANDTLEQAKKIALLGVQDWSKAVAFAQIARAESFFDLGKAKETIQKAKTLALSTKEIGYFKIVLQYEAKFDHENVKKVALTLSDVEGLRSAALFYAVKEEKKVNPAKAKQTACLITHPFHKVNALIELIK
jgi:MalT-like TPR region/F-box-like